MLHQAPPLNADGVVFISPPTYYPWLIPAGIAYLAGYVERQGISTRVIDANTESLEYLLLSNSPSISDTREAFRCLRDADDLRDWRSYAHAMEHLSGLARAVSFLRRDEIVFERNTYRYRPAFELRSREGLLAAARNPDEHIFTPYYLLELIPRLRRSGAALLALSVSDLHQLLPATVLAAVIRDEFGSGCPPLVFGGNVFSRIYNSLTVPDSLNDALHEIWGMVVVGEGERPIVEAVRALLAGGQGEAQGVLKVGVARPAKPPPIDLDCLTPPRCEGFRPLTPSLPVPLNIYRGCYYAGVCTFCDINHGYDSVWASGHTRMEKDRQRLRDLDLVVKDIEWCVKRYDTRVFSFTDEWFLARDMRGLAERLLFKGIRIVWDAYCRFEPELGRPDTAALLARAGARFFQFGLESASLHTLQAVGKGIRPDTSAHVLKTLSAAGVWSHVFVIVGLPGEYLHEGMLTLAFLLRNAEHIFTIKPSRFQLARHAPMAGTALGRSIKVDRERDAVLDLALNLPFRYQEVKFCRRCGGDAAPSAGATACPACRDVLVSRPLVSRRGVNALYAVMDLAAARHWAYPFTSLYPYQTRLLFNQEEARRIAAERAHSTDRNLGRTPSEVRRDVAALCRYLWQEAEQVGSVRAVYERAGFEPPSGWSDVEDVLSFAVRWERACAVTAEPAIGA